MARTRSPNYPSVDLATAVESIRAFYNREKRSAVSPEVAVKAWGFNSLNGTSRSRLSALKQFGLMSTDKQGKVQLSDAGLTLVIASPSSRTYSEALQSAALQPNIFCQLYESMRDASDEALRHELILVRKFSEDGANRLIEAYRSTLTIAGLDDTESDDDSEDEDENASFELVGDDHDSPERLPRRVRQSHNVDAQFRWPLYEGVVAEVTFTRGDFTADDIELLKAYLDIAVKTKKPQTRTSSPPDEVPRQENDDDVPF